MPSPTIVTGLPRAHPGMVLRPQDHDYTDLTEFGKVEIGLSPAQEAIIMVSGFEFQDAETCRICAVKAMCWARDLLNAAIEADRLVPGGRIFCGVD